MSVCLSVPPLPTYSCFFDVLGFACRSSAEFLKDFAYLADLDSMRKQLAPVFSGNLDLCGDGSLLNPDLFRVFNVF